MLKSTATISMGLITSPFANFGYATLLVESSSIMALVALVIACDTCT